MKCATWFFNATPVRFVSAIRAYLFLDPVLWGFGVHRYIGSLEIELGPFSLEFDRRWRDVIVEHSLKYGWSYGSKSNWSYLDDDSSQ